MLLTDVFGLRRVFHIRLARLKSAAPFLTGWHFYTLGKKTLAERYCAPLRQGMTKDLISEPSTLELLLGEGLNAPFADTKAAQTAFTIALLSSDLFVPVEQSEGEQAAQGGVTLQAVEIDSVAHVLLFTSAEKLGAFTGPDTRFARAAGKDIFPNLSGAHAVLNPGPNGRQLTPDDIAALLGEQDAPGHVHGPHCNHDH